MNQCARLSLVTVLFFVFGCGAGGDAPGSTVRPNAGAGNTPAGGGSNNGSGGSGTAGLDINVPVAGSAPVDTGGAGGQDSGKSCDGKLKGYVRDFLAKTSPDFEPFDMSFPNRMPGKMDTNVIEAGIVGASLDANLKPIYQKGDGTGSLTTTGQTNFDTWFRDTPGINQGQELLLQFTLDPADPTMKTYKFDSAPNGFFPIDGMLLGPTTTPPNEGRAHNFSFTFELHTKFTYAPGQKFNFRGDDDVWVFINNKLEIDLGGIHDAFPKNVDLDTLGLTVGQSYPLDFFFAERHVGASDLLCETSIAFTDCDIIVVK